MNRTLGLAAAQLVAANPMQKITANNLMEAAHHPALACMPQGKGILSSNGLSGKRALIPASSSQLSQLSQICLIVNAPSPRKFSPRSMARNRARGSPAVRRFAGNETSLHGVGGCCGWRTIGAGCCRDGWTLLHAAQEQASLDIFWRLPVAPAG